MCVVNLCDPGFRNNLQNHGSSPTASSLSLCSSMRCTKYPVVWNLISQSLAYRGCSLRQYPPPIIIRGRICTERHSCVCHQQFLVSPLAICGHFWKSRRRIYPLPLLHRGMTRRISPHCQCIKSFGTKS